ncbi:hypothetical protein D9619_009210 [Psilocybe cf. subviscida]|uniref:NACHT domain-containing protein n=1 Tax=Psilocybe cf. subviscida TaxID=2480587 RepID=A0A8H5BTQ2_9AGAR|nr:hypothetical protein D9619_009210 [Psilocybe cf. subviscida]
MSGYKRPKRANVSILKNAKNPHIKNSSFTVSNTTNVKISGNGASDPLQKLYDQVARNAILNAGGRADEVRCYPGTREEVVGLMEPWMDGKDSATPNMMWLSGPAGAGKSAIVQTMAERCRQRGVQAASFFFFRADPTRSTAHSLVATLVYQIFKFHPSARQAIATILSDDPLLFDGSIQDQFSQLLSLPWQDTSQLGDSPGRRPIVLLIDGLDECGSRDKSSQRQILQALDRLVMQDNSPFLALVASRAEPQLTMAFKQLASPVNSIFLDEQYQPEKDIRAFVTGEFARIKKAHHLAHMLSDHWPSDEDTESIVKKSSGQFIYAATVMRYLANSSASPKLSLEMVQGIHVPDGTNSPFAHLDGIYKYILSQANDLGAVMDILSVQLLYASINSPMLLYDFEGTLRLCNSRYTPEVLHSCVSDLTAILQFDGDNMGLVFFHASLPDFLKDKSRAEGYYIDMDAFGAKILPAIWMTIPKNSFCKWFWCMDYWSILISPLLM